MEPAGLYFGNARKIDLTHRLHNGMPVWPTHPPFVQSSIADFESGDIACNHSLVLSEHSGTHFDAPCHFIPGAPAIADVPLDRFFGRMATIDASDCAPDTELPAERIEAFERANGPIEPHDAVMIYFGWSKYWAHPSEGERFLKDWPGLSKAAAQLLVARKVRLVACDCLSIDRFGSTDFPAHRTLLGAHILVGENFANLDQLPPYALLSTLPLPIEGGTGSPVRAIAFVPLEA